MTGAGCSDGVSELDATMGAVVRCSQGFHTNAIALTRRSSPGIWRSSRGRHRESRIRANLIADQFSLHLQLRVLKTPIAPFSITNGTTISLETTSGPLHIRRTSRNSCTRLTKVLAADTRGVTVVEARRGWWKSGCLVPTPNDCFSTRCPLITPALSAVSALPRSADAEVPRGGTAGRDFASMYVPNPRNSSIRLLN
jgi:hypothetical protein